MNLTVREDLTVDSITVASLCGVSHEAAIKLLKTHGVKLESRFGPIAFEMRKGPKLEKRISNPTIKMHGGKRAGSGRNLRIAHLTEDQATAFITLFQNTEQVVDFKFALVAAFSEAKARLGVARKRSMIPTSSQLALMVLNRDEELIRTRRMMNLMEPDYSAYGELSSNGRSKTCLRRASFVAAPKGRRSRKNAAKLIALSKEPDLDSETAPLLPFQ